MKDKFLKLTDTVYKVLAFFPESDPLKIRAKDRALAILENLILINETNGWLSFEKEKIKTHVFEDIDILLGYLWIGKSQGWLNSANCLIIANEYEKIKKEIEPRIELTKKLPGMDGLQAAQEKAQRVSDFVSNKAEDGQSQPPYLSPPEATEGRSEITARQRQILEFLGRNEKAQVMDLQAMLPDITKRTIRRDLDELLDAGKIMRLGDYNQVFYQIKC